VLETINKISAEAYMLAPSQDTRIELSWEKVRDEIVALAAKIDYQPDIIIGIARGGMVPSILISQQLNIENIHALKVVKQGMGREVIAEVFTDVSGKNVLVVDDMLETGNGMKEVKKFLEAKGADVRTACLYVMPHTEFNPDYSLQGMTKVIKFPWD